VSNVKKKESAFAFEEGYARAQALVESMERGDMPLDQTFDAYQQAAELLKALEAMLDAGEKKIEMLMAGKVADITEEIRE